MRIGIDTRHLACGFGTGGARVLQNLLKALDQYAPDIEVRRFNSFDHPWWNQSKAGRMTAAILADILGKNVHAPVMARRNKLDALLYALPPISFTEKRIPQICYVHDLPLPIEECSAASRLYNTIYLKQSCIQATRIIAGTQTISAAIQTRYRIPNKRINKVCYPVDMARLSQVPALNPPPQRQGYIFGILSSMNWRKNPGAYIRTFHRLPPSLRNRYPLVLAGAVRSLEDLNKYVEPDVLRDIYHDVFCLGRIPDEQLIGTLKGANALLFPSRYEGFGLPALEAIACNVPVVASTIPVFQEVFGDVAHLFDPMDAEGMAEQLASILSGTTPPLPEEQRQTFLKDFTLETYAKQIQGFLLEVCP